MANNSTRPGLIGGVLKDLLGVCLTRRQIAQTTNMAKLVDHMQESKTMEGNMSDTDRIFTYLNNLGASYVALYHGASNAVCNADLKRSTDWKVWTQ